MEISNLEKKKMLLEDLENIYKTLDKYDRDLLPINSLEELLGIVDEKIEVLKKECKNEN